MTELSSNEILRLNMRYYRIINKLTQAEIAEELNITEKHYCHLENGDYQITLENLDLIAKIFNKKSWELLKERHTQEEVPSRLDYYTGKRKK